MKKTKQFLALLLCFVMVLCGVAVGDVSVQAAELGSVRVKVENTTDTSKAWSGQLFTQADGADAEGYVEVPLTANMTAMDCLKTALTKANKDYNITFNDSWGSNSINGIGGINDSNWTTVVNDWVTNGTLDASKTEDNTLRAGDEIAVYYTTNWGADVGYDWSDTNPVLQALSFSSGNDTISPAFSSDKTEYVYSLPEGVTSFKIATKANKAFRVIVQKNEYDKTKPGYRRNDTMEVSSGDTVYISVGEDGYNVTPAFYKLHIVNAGEQYVPVNEGFTLFELAGEDFYENQWVTGKTFQAAKKTYELQLKSNSRSAITIADNNYDTLTYASAKVSYTNANGEAVEKALLPRTKLVLDNLAVGTTTISVVLTKKDDSAKTTAYTLQVKRPELPAAFGTKKEAENIVKELRKANTVKGNAAYGREWDVFSMARSGKLSDSDKKAYIASVKKTVKELKSNKLNDTYATENAKVVLTLAALGYDATDVAGYDLVKALEDTDWVAKQGLNGVVWSLLALHSGDYDTPDDVIDLYIDTILAAKTKDGGFTYYGDVADADMTSMVIQALAPYYATNSRVKQTLDGAVELLSAMQSEDGGYGYAGYGTNCESTAQVVIALCTLGINPSTDARFVKNGVSVLTALHQYYLGDGAFAHEPGGSANAMATDQGMRAMIAYYRLLTGKTALYDTQLAKKTDETKNTENKANGNTNADANVKSPKTGENEQPITTVLLLLAAAMAVTAGSRTRQRSRE